MEKVLSLMTWHSTFLQECRGKLTLLSNSATWHEDMEKWKIQSLVLWWVFQVEDGQAPFFTAQAKPPPVCKIHLHAVHHGIHRYLLPPHNMACLSNADVWVKLAFWMQKCKLPKTIANSVDAENSRFWWKLHQVGAKRHGFNYCTFGSHSFLAEIQMGKLFHFDKKPKATTCRSHAERHELLQAIFKIYSWVFEEAFTSGIPDDKQVGECNGKETRLRHHPS